MKSLLLMTILSLFFVYATPGGAQDDDYKKMIFEFENYHSVYQPGLLNTEPEQQVPYSNSIKTDAELDELKRRWDQLVERIFEKESYFHIDKEEWEEIKHMGENPDEALSYLKAHPDIDSFLKVAVARNLTLQSVKTQMEAKLESYPQVIQLEDILNQFSSFVKELDIKAGPTQHQTTIKQSTPFPGALSLKGNIAEQEVRIAKVKYEIALRDMVTEIKEAFHEWAFLAQAVSITEDHINLLKELETVASAHFRAGKGGFNDVIKAQIKISKLRDDLINLKEKEDVVQTRISWFINISSKPLLPPPASNPLVPVHLSYTELTDIAFNNQQELQLLLEEINKSGLAISLAEKMVYPDLTPGFSYFEDRKGERIGTVKTSESFEKRANVQPSYWFGNNDAYIREARMNYQSLIKTLEDHKEELRYMVNKFFYELDKSKRAIKLYEYSVIPLAQKVLEGSIAEYRTGKTDFLSLLDAEITLLKFRNDYQRALKNHGQKKAGLEQLIGKRLSEVEEK